MHTDQVSVGCLWCLTGEGLLQGLQPEKQIDSNIAFLHPQYAYQPSAAGHGLYIEVNGAEAEKYLEFLVRQTSNENTGDPGRGT